MSDLWQAAFVTPIKEFFEQVFDFLPHLLTMVVIVAFGLVAASLIRVGVSRLLRIARFDQLSTRIGFSDALAKGGVKDHPSILVGRVVYWAILLLFLILGLGALKLKGVDRFVDQAFTYIPHLLVAFIILMVGFILANFFGRAALIAAVNAQITQARLLARSVRLAVILFALAMAFEQLGIATAIIVAAFSIAFGGVVLALAIAFGLGAKDAAKEFIDKRFRKEPEPKNEEEISHL
jgi:hypothetical protein